MTDRFPPRSIVHVITLGSAQTIAWASSTYLPAVLGTPIAAEFGMSPATVFAAYSFALIVMATLGPAVGRAIDGKGGRGVLCWSNGVLAAGLCLLGGATGPLMMFGAWAVIGAGMALGLYDAAFAALVRMHGVNARPSITGITLLGGFASTVGWPLTSAVAGALDWRFACFMWAAAHLLVALPLNWFSLSAPYDGRQAADFPALGADAGDPTEPRRTFVLLAVFGAATAFVTSAMAAHLPGVLVAMGAAAGTAITASALVGPAQVVARLFEFVAARHSRIHPLSTARLASTLHPLGGACMLASGGLAWVAPLFAALHGAGNGLITIAKGTLPLALFGGRGYGSRQGTLAVSQRMMQAAAPFVFALVLERWGGGAAMVLTGVLSGLAFLALLGIKKPNRLPGL